MPATETGLKRLIWLTGLNGFSITVFAGVVTLILLPFSFSWVALGTGLAVSASGCLEIVGHLNLRKGSCDGLRWASYSQIGVLLALLVYCTIQLYQLNPSLILASLSPASLQLLLDLYQLDRSDLGVLLVFLGRMFYVSIALASLFYQGGLFFYYRRWWRRIGSIELKT